MKWLFHSCFTLSRSSCGKSENTNQTHSMTKWFPKANFPSITSALKNLWPTQWSAFHYLTISFGCADWHVKMNNYVQPFHQIKSTVKQPVYHSQRHSLFEPTLVAVRFLPLHWGKTGWNHGIIVTFTYLEPQYSPGKSIHAAMCTLAGRFLFVVSVNMNLRFDRVNCMIDTAASWPVEG